MVLHIFKKSFKFKRYIYYKTLWNFIEILLNILLRKTSL